MGEWSWVIARPSIAGAKKLYELQGDKLRFLVVGMFNTILSYALFALLLTLLGDPLRSLSDSTSGAAALIGGHYYAVVQWANWVLCVPPNTLAMKYFAFRSTGRWQRQVGRAYLVYLPAQLVSFAILEFAVQVLHLDPLLGQLLAIGIALIASYVGHKYFTFKEARPAGDHRPEDGGRS